MDLPRVNKKIINHLTMHNAIVQTFCVKKSLNDPIIIHRILNFYIKKVHWTPLKFELLHYLSPVLQHVCFNRQLPSPTNCNHDSSNGKCHPGHLQRVPTHTVYEQCIIYSQVILLLIVCPYNVTVIFVKCTANLVKHFVRLFIPLEWQITPIQSNLI